MPPSDFAASKKKPAKADFVYDSSKKGRNKVDFSFSEDQKMLQKAVRDFSNEKLAPVADKYDQEQHFPIENFKMMAELGFLGMVLPTEYGGGGSDYVSLVIVMEEVARGCASTCDILNAHQMLCAWPIAHYGTPEQKKKFLAPLATGAKIGAFGLTEPEAGSDMSNIQTTAVLDGNHYILNGGKIFITNGDVCDIALVFVKVNDLGKSWITPFIVETGTPGFSKGKKFNKLGMRAGTAGELVFEDCRVPVANRLGEVGQGAKIALSTIDYGRIGIAAQGLGVTQAVLEKSIEYAKTRVQFGQPIGKNQGIAWKLADMFAKLEAARLVIYKAAQLANEGKNFTREISIGKLLSSELAMKAATDGIQIYGGYGYMMDSPMQRFFRDAKLIEIYEGTSEIQRFIISRDLLK
jgi:butyryl-CoA dehydrogenase